MSLFLSLMFLNLVVVLKKGVSRLALTDVVVYHVYHIPIYVQYIVCIVSWGMYFTSPLHYRELLVVVKIFASLASIHRIKHPVKASSPISALQ